MKSLNLNIFEEFPRLETARLILRPFEDRDIIPIFNWRNNALMGKHLSRPAQSSEDEARALYERMQQGYRQQQSISWIAALKRDPAVAIGACGFNRLDIPNLRAEIGGEMHPDFWGKRFALESTKAIVDFGLGPMGLHSIEARTSPQNKSSIALLEHLGFVKEAHLHECIYKAGVFGDVVIYSKLSTSS